MLSVNILVQAIEIALTIPEKERRWLGLSGIVAARQVVLVSGRISRIDAHDLIPAVG